MKTTGSLTVNRASRSAAPLRIDYSRAASLHILKVGSMAGMLASGFLIRMKAFKVCACWSCSARRSMPRTMQLLSVHPFEEAPLHIN